MTNNVKDKATRYSSKYMSIYQLKTLVEFFNQKYGNDYQILLLTPFGFIKGDLEETSEKDDFLTKNPESPNSFKVDLSYLIQMRHEHLKKLKEKETIEVIDNGATLNFTNVEIYKDDLSNPIVKLEQMLVFADQIISFSLVPRQLS